MPSEPCGLDSPCLFNIFNDPTEHHDVSSRHPKIMLRMKARVLELLQGEVTLKTSNLCPTSTGTKPDPAMTRLAVSTGFWEPWMAYPPPQRTSELEVRNKEDAAA